MIVPAVYELLGPRNSSEGNWIGSGLEEIEKRKDVSSTVVVDDIIGASVSGSIFYSWPTGLFGSNYNYRLGIMHSRDICFV